VDDETLRTKIREILFQVAPNKPSKFGRDTELVSELAYHSLAILEAIFTIEEEVEIELVDYGNADEITTVGDVEDYVLRVLSESQVS
jgi:acyl carrier protein